MKQVIVMRTDLNMRKGKMIAQGAHASLSAFIVADGSNPKVANQWLINDGQKKICLQIDSEQGLTNLAESAKFAGLTVYTVTDAGHTEFHGVPTKTCICIGPNDDEEIDKITGGLKLL
jgi:PTH2 family peptidyl-tRNA hydrolase